VVNFLVSSTSRIGWAVFALLLALAPLPLWAEGRIQGRVVNGTTGEPAPYQLVQLLMPRGGMRQVATAKADSSGHFVFSNSDVDPGSFYLLQAVYEGVNYHGPVQFDSNGAATVNLTVYNSTRAAPALRVQSARLIIRAEGGKARVQEMFALENPSAPPVSFADPDGTFRFRLSSSAGEPTAAVAGLMNMPLPQPVQEGKTRGEYSLNYALKPGLTVVMVAYDAVYSAGRLALADSVPYPIDRVELLVSPTNLAVDSSLFARAGTDSETGSERFQAERLAGGTVLEATVSGEAAAEAPAPSESGQAGSEVKIQPNSITRLGVPLLACFLLVLFWALGVRATKEWPRRKDQHPADPVHKELEAKVEALFNSLADLDELFAAGKIAEKQYWKERLDLKARLAATFKKVPPAVLESYATRNLAR